MRIIKMTEVSRTLGIRPAYVIPFLSLVASLSQGDSVVGSQFKIEKVGEDLFKLVIDEQVINELVTDILSIVAEEDDGVTSG